MFACLERAKCWEALHDPGRSGTLDSEEVRKLATAAGYSKEMAEEIARSRALDRLRSDLPA